MHRIETTPNTILDSIRWMDIAIGLMQDQLDEMEVLDKDDQTVWDGLIDQSRKAHEHKESLIELLPWYLVKYEVSREYGGPEEGGWYYDWYKPVTTELVVLTTERDQARWLADTLNEKEQAIKKEDGQRDRFSQIGTPDLVWIVERVPGQHESKEHPRYE